MTGDVWLGGPANGPGVDERGVALGACCHAS